MSSPNLLVEKSAPSNIALIKYMGKVDQANNVPSNSSLSWTLSQLTSHVRLTVRPDLNQDQWQALSGAGFEKINLSDKSMARFLQHLQNIKERFAIHEPLLVESANTFPADCGLASSASSFAALTMAAVELCEKLTDKVGETSLSEQADISRQGSGSSCRSFFGPWCLWYSEGVRPLEFPVGHLKHQVIVVADQKKEVSSSEAHKRVVTATSFSGRPERAEKRLAHLMEALRQADWERLYQICWDEFSDMHNLFTDSQPAFSYMQKGSQQVLQQVQDIWQVKKDGPLVTMDAGANVHLLYRPDQTLLMKELSDIFNKNFRVVGI